MHVGDVIREYFLPIASTPTIVGPDTVSSCVSEDECSSNGSKKKCFLGQCVECHRNNQCVQPGKLRCNTQTFSCEDGHYLGAYLTRKLASEKIAGDMDNTENSLLELNFGTLPDLYANTRY